MTSKQIKKMVSVEMLRQKRQTEKAKQAIAAEYRKGFAAGKRAAVIPLPPDDLLLMAQNRMAAAFARHVTEKMPDNGAPPKIVYDVALEVWEQLISFGQIRAFMEYRLDLERCEHLLSVRVPEFHLAMRYAAFAGWEGRA